jgi:hypothetical protein
MAANISTVPETPAFGTEPLKIVIYYRGLLRSCNYRCSYCPFGKRRPSKARLERDAAALSRFCGRVNELGPDLSIMLAPRGEALIHGYYWEALARLCGYANISQAACQTNASFSVEEFSGRLSGCRDKLRLWCSFHPSQTSLDAFLARCMLLYEKGFSLCAGAAGDPANAALIAELRRRLPPEIHVWINAMEGMKRLYTEAEKTAFARIDPHFSLETAARPADTAKCYAGRRGFFIGGNGDIFACNISGIKLGNLYKGLSSFPPVSYRYAICRARDCRCYLAYVNRTDIPELDQFGTGRFCRVPCAPTPGLCCSGVP